MTPLRTLVRAERGSALLISMVMIVIITVLGLALFELGQIEGQQSRASLGEARAFEVAQAGLERAIRELRNSFLADPYGSESWVDGTNRPTCTPACETAVYRPMNLANNTLPASGTDPGGTFVIELKQVLVAEANNPIDQGAGYTYPYGQTCIPSLPANGNVCANLIFVRSTGTAAGPPGYTATRTVQALIKATSTSYFAGGLTANVAEGNDPAVDGRALIAGSIGILGSNSISPAFRIDGGATMGMRNNWAALWPDTNTPPTLARLTPRQLVCPTGANCAGGANVVESLGAELKIYGNISNTMVTLNGGTDLGINAIQTANYGDNIVTPIRRGKGRIDGVYVADGCPMPCTSDAFTFNGGSLIYVDTNNYTKPYPDRPPKLPLSSQQGVATSPVYPTAADPTVIAGTTYANWWANYFSAHASPVLNGLNANGGSCGASYSSSGLNTIGDGFNSLDDTSSSGDSILKGFCHQFPFTDKTGAARTGEICWKRNVNSVSANVLNLPPNYAAMPTLEFGIPSCDKPSGPANPDPSVRWILLPIRNYGGFATRKNAVDVTIQYRGQAIIFLNTANIDIQQTLQTTCAAANPTCAGERFPEDNLLILIQQGDGNTDIARNNPATSVERFMGYVYSASRIRAWRQTNIVGSLRAQQFCFNNFSAGGCGGAGTGVGNPRFFQANFIDLRQIPAELPASSGDSGDRWLVDVVPRFWMVCRRGPGDALPTTPTGTCQYQ